MEIDKVLEKEQKSSVKVTTEVKVLIEKVCSASMHSQIPQTSVENLKVIYQKSNSKNKDIEKLLKEHEVNNELFVCYPGLEIDGQKCDVCGKAMRECYPIKIGCNKHATCIKCIVDSFAKTFSSYCFKCRREYPDDELSLISSFIQN